MPEDRPFPHHWTEDPAALVGLAGQDVESQGAQRKRQELLVQAVEEMAEKALVH
jgi:hypothetical protein